MTANTPQRPKAVPSAGYQRRLDSSERARRPCVVWDSRIHCLQVLPRSAPVAYPAPAVGLHPVARLCRQPLPAAAWHHVYGPVPRCLLSRLSLLGPHACFRLPFPPPTTPPPPLAAAVSVEPSAPASALASARNKQPAGGRPKIH